MNQAGAHLEEHRSALWGLCYRMTGCAADADELVQETFTRALAAPPARVDEPWRPWLVTVALNLSRDVLRRRKARGYVGPWLPAPVPDEPAHEEGAEARYGAAEGASYAYLLALEALTPLQRGAVILREVFDYSVREAARALEVSEGALKVVHLRARRALARHAARRGAAPAAPPQVALDAMGRFFAGVASGDLRAIEQLLREDVVMHNDGAGEFFAARIPVVGRARVARFLFNGATRHAFSETRALSCNGCPALFTSYADPRPGEPPRALTLFFFDEEGRIAQLFGIVASRKLRAIIGYDAR